MIKYYYPEIKDLEELPTRGTFFTISSVEKQEWLCKEGYSNKTMTVNQVGYIIINVDDKKYEITAKDGLFFQGNDTGEGFQLKNTIYIHYDFTNNSELSYADGRKSKTSFSTCCLSFFRFDKLTTQRDVIIIRNDGRYISAWELLENTGEYCDKEIRISHNIEKMFIANKFKWKRGLITPVKI